jgi:hypothetical protein
MVIFQYILGAVRGAGAAEKEPPASAEATAVMTRRQRGDPVRGTMRIEPGGPQQKIDR